MKYLIILAVCFTAVAAEIAQLCEESKCANSTCRCSTTQPPIKGVIPQLVSITFNEAIVQKYYDSVWLPLLKDRKNADGSNISATFFVPHEYTDYSLVLKLYNMGHEIGVHSISKDPNQPHWRESPVEILLQEFEGQRQIINTFARIPTPEIRGARVPQLQFNKNATFQAYVKAGLMYDNSWPTAPTKRLFPYTLDYASTEECSASATCPNEKFPGFWVNPIIDLRGANGTYCHEMHGCEKNGTVDEIASWLLEQVEASYSDNRAPVTFLADASWFDNVESSLKGMTKFLDELKKFKDVFVVSQYDIVRFMSNPVTADKYKPTSKTHNSKCDPKICTYTFENKPRSMVSCIACPKTYPWLGNPKGK